MKWRICTHRTRPASAVEVDNAMSTADVVEALTVLDEYDAARKRAEGQK